MGSYLIEAATRSGSDLGALASLVAEFHSAGLPLNVHSNVYEKSRLVKAGPGYLFGFTVYNSNVAAQFIQVHDSPTLPANGSVPCMVISVATIADKGVQWLPLGRAFQTGIYLCNSTTGPTLTLGAADCFFDAQFV